MKRFTNSRKFLFGLSVSMVLAMAIGSFALSETQTPASPRAVEAQNAVGATFGPFTVDGGTQGTNFDYTSPVLTIHSGNLTISTNGVTTERIVVDGAATITLKNVNISTDSGAALQIQDNATFNVNILLADGSNNILEGKAGTDSSNPGSPGIQKNGEDDNIGTLTIGVPDGSTGTGKLQATGGRYGAGIGGGKNGSGSNITINSGEVTATGGYNGAGIGGGQNGSGSNITINGGVVTAYGGTGGAGIGGGNNYGDGDGITINGGVVTAYGGKDGAGIGGGEYYGDGKNIRISGGIVTAIAGFEPSSMGRAAGIGGGYQGEGDGITISGGEVTATGGQYAAGIGGGYNRNGSNITINGGEVTANGGENGAGIGGGYYGDGDGITINGGVVMAYGGKDGAGIGGGYNRHGKNITINGGVVMAYGGKDGAGIGGGYYGDGDGITISGGAVTANGGENGAGIGGGDQRNGNNITITGGKVTATGGSYGFGIGGGRYGSGSNNSLNGDAVVLATSGDTSKAALEGFDSLLTKGIAFTGLGTAFDDKGHATAFSWDESGTMYGNVALSQDLEIPANLTIPAGQILSIKEGKEVILSEKTGVKYTVEGELRNNGAVTLPADLAFNGNGKVTTKTDFYLESSTDIYTTGYQIYKTSAGVQKYTNLPNPDQTNANGFVNWYYIDQDGKKIKIDENSFVTLNAHSFYENLYSISVAELENGSVTPDVTEAAKDDTVTLTVTPADGYQLKEGSLTVTDADGNEVPLTEQDGKYTFTMPDSEVEISAEFELIPEPSVDPDQDGGGSSKTGDSFAGIAALAILGLATTGAVMLRKRK